MDRAVHKRPGFALGIAMSSNRIENYETINGENLCAWYTGDGMTYLSMTTTWPNTPIVSGRR
ncbi:MAG: polysaccharide lyase family 8 super-sandwich domain-containing protein [Alistipes indistinctus]